MALRVGVQPITWFGEVSVTVGQVTGASSKTCTATVPSYIGTDSAVLVTTASSMDNGLAIGHAWVSAAGTVSFKVINSTGGNLTPAGDPITVKILVF